MEILESKDGEVHVLAPKGSLNTQTSPKLEQKLQALLASKGRRLVVDFKNVDYLSSAALRVLLMITRRLVRAHGRLVLCAMSDDLKKVFSISGFDRDFTILASRGEAVELAATTPPPPAGSEPEAKAGKGKSKAKAAGAKAEEPKPETDAAKPAVAATPGWPFLAAPAKPKPEPQPPAPEAAPAVVSRDKSNQDTEDSPVPNLALVIHILGKGEGTPPWNAWAAAPAAAALGQRVAGILARGL